MEMSAMPSRSNQVALSILIVDPDPRAYFPLVTHDRWPEAELTWCFFRSARASLRWTIACRAWLTGPSVWFVNTRLPDLSSDELVPMLADRLPDRQFILVGDAYAADEEIAARRHGATGYLCKPVSEQWVRLLDGILRHVVRPAPTGRSPYSFRPPHDRWESHRIDQPLVNIKPPKGA
jgi:DNA-binding NtrC family response regulator